MEQYKKDFIEFALESKALKFGDFTLKSGRKSPFFFNAGSFFTGKEVNLLSSYYAQAIEKEFKDYNVIFGPAYKGIPLAVSTVSSLYSLYKKDVSYASNRKESKDHGEKGIILGHPLSDEDKIILIDDVVTSGASVLESLDLLKDVTKAEVLGLIVSVDRQEKAKDSDNSALKDIELNHHFKATSIVSMKEVILYAKESHPEIMTEEMLSRIVAYYKEYGAEGCYLG